MTVKKENDDRFVRTKIDIAHKQWEAIEEFIRDNREVFAKFKNMVDVFNDERKAALKAMGALAPGFSYRSFSKTDPQERIAFDPGRLPANVLAISGVVKSVDDERIANLVVSGEISERDVADARGTKTATPACKAGDLAEAVFPFSLV